MHRNLALTFAVRALALDGRVCSLALCLGFEERWGDFHGELDGGAVAGQRVGGPDAGGGGPGRSARWEVDGGVAGGVRVGVRGCGGHCFLFPFGLGLGFVMGAGCWMRS